MIHVKNLFIIISIFLITMQAEANERTDVVCSYAPSQSVLVSRIAHGFGGAGLGAAAILQAAGMSAVLHSSGAYIFTGTGGYVAGTLGVAVVAPVLITASVVVGGSAIALELSCAPKNHPDSIKKIKEITAAFNIAALSANEQAIVVRDNAGKNIRTLNDHAIDIRDATFSKARAVNVLPIEFRDQESQFLSRGALKIKGESIEK